MSGKKKTIKRVEMNEEPIDHKLGSLREACHLTPERAMQLEVMFSPAFPNDETNVTNEQNIEKNPMGLRWSNIAEEIVNLPLSEATYIVGKLLREIYEAHPNALAHRHHRKPVFFILESEEDSCALLNVEKMIARDKGLETCLVGQVIEREIFGVGMWYIAKQGERMMQELVSANGDVEKIRKAIERFKAGSDFKFQ